jgi:hypothetical protein
MEKVKVMVKDKTTLVLLQDASNGDIIDLNDLNEIDYSQIEELIDSGKDSIYLKKLEEFKKVINLENQKVVNDKVNEFTKIIDSLKNELTLKEKENQMLLKSKEVEIEKKYLDRINSLQKEIEKNNLIKIN